MRTGKALATLVAAMGVSSCTCAPAPAPEAEHAAPAPSKMSGIRGQVRLGTGVADGVVPAIRVRVVPEATMIPFLGDRLGEARKGLALLASERERASRDAEAAIAAADRTDQAWKSTTETDLYRRVEVLLRRPRDPREVEAVHGDLLARKKAAYERATRAARASAEKERKRDALERQAGEFGDARFFVEDLPAAIASARSDGTGAFEFPLEPGRYALVALPEGDPGLTKGLGGWLLWIEIATGGPTPILLDERNRHGTDCGACMVAVKELR